MNPPEEKERMNQIFTTLGYVDKKGGTIYAYLTGKFPITIIDGMTEMFIMYEPRQNQSKNTSQSHAHQQIKGT